MQLTVQLSVKARRNSVAVSDPNRPAETIEAAPTQPVGEETGQPRFVRITDAQVIVFETLEAWLANEEPDQEW